MACALFGFAMSVPTVVLAQTKSKATAKSTSKAKSKAKTTRAKTSKAKISKAKASVKPKAQTVTAGAFQPLRDTDRIQVILPRRKETKASDLTVARSRTQVFTNRTVKAAASNLRLMTATSYPTTAVVVNTGVRNWWGYNGPPSSTTYNPTYGYITTVSYSWGNVMYTYGYQVVNYWNGNGYDWVAYNGLPGIAYPVIYQ